MSGSPAAVAAAAVPLHPLRVLRDVARVYRAHWWALVLGALAVFAPLAAADAGLEQALHYAHADVTILEGFAQTALHLLGEALYAGLVASTVVAWRAGERRVSPLHVIRWLPWWTIVALDLILAAGTAAGLVLLIAPGVWFATRYGLAPAAAKIEHLGVRASLRRSAELVRGRFWRVLAVLAPVTLLGAAIEQALQSRIAPYAGDLAVNLAVQAITGPFVALATVLVVLELSGVPRAR